MRILKIGVLLVVLLVVGFTRLGTSVLDPEIGTSVAVRQVENSDHVRQQMRAFEHGKRSLFTATDLAVPITAIVLFGGDLAGWVAKRKTIAAGGRA